LKLGNTEICTLFGKIIYFVLDHKAKSKLLSDWSKKLIIWFFTLKFEKLATSRISIKNFDNIHEEILEEVEANTFSPATDSSHEDASHEEKSRIIRATPLNYAQEYLYIKMTTTRSTGSGGGGGSGGMTMTSAAMGGVFTTSPSSSKRQHTFLSPLREAKSARSLLAACENDDEVGKIRRPPSPLALPRGVDKSTEQQQQQQQREKRKKPRSRERKKEDSKLLRAQTVDTKGERVPRRKFECLQITGLNPKKASEFV
jgi:hypothetical protein